MRLEYVYIKKYRALRNQGFDLSNEFVIDFNEDNSQLKIIRSPHYIKDFFGQNVQSMSGIIGENGAGKTTFINYIKEVLSMPKNGSDDTLGLFIFFNTYDQSFCIIDNLNTNKEIQLNPSPELTNKAIVHKLADLKPAKIEEYYFNSTFTLLESVPGLERLAIVHLSTIFELTRQERDYGIMRRPLLLNYSTNYLLKRSLSSPNEQTVATAEAKRMLSLIVNTTDFGPEMRYPETIKIIVNHIKIQYFLIGDLVKTKNNDDNLEKRRDLLLQNKLVNSFSKREIEFKNEKERIRCWLFLNLAIDILPYIKEENLEEFIGKLSIDGIDAFGESIFQLLRSSEKYLHPNNNWQITDGFWNNYQEHYNKLINLTFEFYDEKVRDIGSDSAYADYNSFDIKLIPENYELLKEYLDAIDFVTISSNSLINFIWSNCSSGEISMLSLFGRLYEIQQQLKSVEGQLIDTIWFLLDECDNSFHPQWEKMFNKLLLDFINRHFGDIKCQIIFASHSPLSISDLPKKNIIFMKKERGKLIAQKSLNEHKQTFAANINQLLTDSFFIQNGLIGEFANHAISTVIELLYDKSIEDISENRAYIEKIINIIGEPVIQSKLLSKLENRLRANLITIKNDIDNLKSPTKP